GGYQRCCYCVESEFFYPRWLNEKLFAKSNCRPNARHGGMSERLLRLFLQCRAFSFFWAQKDMKARVEEKYK
ncbi:MAG: hypothetical protein IJF06_00800, partial [Bacteroidaceae bacterium]|nr:hypothetical protein [Bacteroidaceae bacterium]